MHDVIVANGACHGGGDDARPDARPDDGLFDVVLIGDVTKRDFVHDRAEALQGHAPRPPEGRAPTRRSGVAVDAPERLPIELDGEQVGTTPVRFEIVPAGAARACPGVARSAPSRRRSRSSPCSSRSAPSDASTSGRSSTSCPGVEFRTRASRSLTDSLVPLRHRTGTTAGRSPSNLVALPGIASSSRLRSSPRSLAQARGRAPRRPSPSRCSARRCSTRPALFHDGVAHRPRSTRRSRAVTRCAS